MATPPKRAARKPAPGLKIDVPEPQAVASPSVNNQYVCKTPFLLVCLLFTHSCSSSPSLDFVVKGLSIGKNGLSVDGKQASIIAHLDDLIDLPEILGQGSFGIVRKVQHKQTGVIYAKKVCNS